MHTYIFINELFYITTQVNLFATSRKISREICHNPFLRATALIGRIIGLKRSAERRFRDSKAVGESQAAKKI